MIRRNGKIYVAGRYQRTYSRHCGIHKRHLKKMKILMNVFSLPCSHSILISQFYHIPRHHKKMKLSRNCAKLEKQLKKKFDTNAVTGHRTDSFLIFYLNMKLLRGPT